MVLRQVLVGTEIDVHFDLLVALGSVIASYICFEFAVNTPITCILNFILFFIQLVTLFIFVSRSDLLDSDISRLNLVISISCLTALLALQLI